MEKFKIWGTNILKENASKFKETSSKNKIIIVSSLLAVIVILIISINFKNIQTKFYVYTKNYEELFDRIDNNIIILKDITITENKQGKIKRKSRELITAIIKSDNEDSKP